jgi:hypothetical protein
MFLNLVQLFLLLNSLHLNTEMAIKIIYDTPIEVTESQYKMLMNKFCSIIAGREENGKYFIKLWVMRYKDSIKNFLNG